MKAISNTSFYLRVPGMFGPTTRGSDDVGCFRRASLALRLLQVVCLSSSLHATSSRKRPLLVCLIYQQRSMRNVLLLLAAAALSMSAVLSAPACGVHRDVGSCYQRGVTLLLRTADNDPDLCCAACAKHATCDSWVYNPSGGGHKETHHTCACSCGRL